MEKTFDDKSQKWEIDTARYVMFAQQDWGRIEKNIKANYLPEDDSPYCYRVGKDI